MSLATNAVALWSCEGGAAALEPAPRPADRLVAMAPLVQSLACVKQVDMAAR
jgi:hypothetical protein